MTRERLIVNFFTTISPKWIGRLLESSPASFSTVFASWIWRPKGILESSYAAISSCWRRSRLITDNVSKITTSLCRELPNPPILMSSTISSFPALDPVVCPALSTMNASRHTTLAEEVLIVNKKITIFFSREREREFDAKLIATFQTIWLRPSSVRPLVLLSLSRPSSWPSTGLVMTRTIVTRDPARILW